MTAHDPDVLAALPKRKRDQIERMAEAFDAIDALLHRLGLQGLQRMSRASADELGALGQTAHNAGLITIERELNRLTTLLTRALERDPLFDMHDWQATQSRIWMLARRARARFEAGALPDDMLGLIGVARRSYAPVDGPLELQALGADGWVSDTGFVGVTVHYAAEDGALYQAVNARPTLHFGDDPVRLLRWPAHDALDESLGELSHGAWRFEGARVSLDRRLSIHKDLRVHPAPYVGGRAYGAVHAPDWRAALERLRRTPVGQPTLVYLEPTAMSVVETDHTRNRARAVARDAHGARLHVEAALRAENNLLIDNLERMYGPRRDGAAPRCDGLFGRLDLTGDGLRLSPITGVWVQPLKLARRRRPAHHTVHLSLESLEGARRA